MEDLYVLRTNEEIEALEEYLSDKELISIDTETTGLEKTRKIIGFSVAAELDKAFYVVLKEFDPFSNELTQLNNWEASKKLLEGLRGRKLVAHNSIFDIETINLEFEIDLMPDVFADTLVMAHILNENRFLGLKDLGTQYFGESATDEQKLMKESIIKNGGSATKGCYELYKADPDLIGKYGAKDTILTLKLFVEFAKEIENTPLEAFFFEEESMPLLRGATYQLNTLGLKIDEERLQKLKVELIETCRRDKEFIEAAIKPLVQAEYPATNKKNTFNIGSGKQLSWLLFVKLNNDFIDLTKEGKNILREMGVRMPFSAKARREVRAILTQKKGEIYQESRFNSKTKKMSRPKKVGDIQNYLASDKPVLQHFAKRYRWVEKLLEYSKNLKLLNTYVEGIQEKAINGYIYPSFLQHGTTSGRYSSRNPNFQNLPREDKRIKSCISAGDGMSFVGADYSQLEPRVFASLSKDESLLDCFKSGDDFYSTIGSRVFDKHGISLKKEDKNSFADLFPELRQISKVVALSSTYGTTASKMAKAIGKDKQEAQEVIDEYFRKFPGVATFMKESHELVKSNGYVESIYGRPRRIPKARAIPELYGKTEHKDLPYDTRNLLNLAVNHRVQSSGASIVNRASIRFLELVKIAGIPDCAIVLQVHDEIVARCPEQYAVKVKELLKEAMENTVILPGVDLVAEPKIGKTLADLK